MYLTPEGYRSGRRGGGRRRTPDGKKGRVSTQQEARCNTYARETRVGFQEKRRCARERASQRGILQLIRLALTLGFVSPRRDVVEIFLSLSCRRLHGVTRNLINSDIFLKRPFQIFQQSLTSLQKMYIFKFKIFSLRDS